MNILHSDPLARTLWSSNGSPSARPKPLNDVQLYAMALALTNEFQLIQGPPGDEYLHKQLAALTVYVTFPNNFGPLHQAHVQYMVVARDFLHYAQQSV